MIEVLFTKHDIYVGKESTKTHQVQTPEKARAKAAAIASVNKLPLSSIVEETNDAGELIRVTITLEAPAPVRIEASPELAKESDLVELRARIEHLEQLVGIKSS